jgi:hypothetical protein
MRENMAAINFHLRDSLYEHLKARAGQDGISIDQFIATAVAEKLAALKADDDLGPRAARGDRDRFDRVLAKVRDVPAEENDRLPDGEEDGLDMKQVGALVEAAMGEEDADDPLLDSYQQ